MRSMTFPTSAATFRGLALRVNKAKRLGELLGKHTGTRFWLPLASLAHRDAPRASTAQQAAAPCRVGVSSARYPGRGSAAHLVCGRGDSSGRAGVGVGGRCTQATMSQSVLQTMAASGVGRSTPRRMASSTCRPTEANPARAGSGRPSSAATRTPRRPKHHSKCEELAAFLRERRPRWPRLRDAAAPRSPATPSRTNQPRTHAASPCAPR
jgi:hypothetical protein